MPIHLNSKISRREWVGATSILALSQFTSATDETLAPEHWAFLSDSHIAGDKTKVVRDTNMATNLEKVVGEVLQEKETLSGVLIDGDCALDAGYKEDYETLAELIAPLAEAGLPIHMTLGNHDNRDTFYETFSKYQPETPVVASKHVARVESKSVNLIFLDTLRYVNKVEGEMGPDQLKWLSETLEASSKPTLLIGHHYPQVIRKDVVPDKAVKVAGLIDSESFLKVAHSNKQAKAYVFGHSHKWGMKKDEKGFYHVNLPPTAYVFDEKQPNGWVKASFYSDRAELTMRCLDKDHSAHDKTEILKW